MKTEAPGAEVATSTLPADPVQSDAVRFGDVSQVQIHLFHRVAAIIIKGGHVGAFDGAKLGPPAQNCPVNHTYGGSIEEKKTPKQSDNPTHYRCRGKQVDILLSPCPSGSQR